MIATDASRLAARRTLERLKRGVPPTDNITALTVGMDRLSRKLNRLLQADCDQRWFFVVSEYGEGKSHFHSFSRSQSLNTGYAVASLDVNKDESAIHQPQRHLSVLLNSLESPKPEFNSCQGIVEIIRHWLEITPKQDVERVLNQLARTRSSTHAGRDPDNFQSLVLQYVRDRNRGVADYYSLQRLLQYFSCEDLNAKGSYARFAASFRFQVIEQWLTATGHQGLYLFIDEVDNIVRQIHGKGHPACFRTLAWYCSSNTFQQTRVVFAATPDVIQMLTSQKSYFQDNLTRQATVRPEEVKAFARWSKEFEEHLPFHNLRCPKLTSSLRTELLHRVVNLHGQAWGSTETDDKLSMLATIQNENPRRWMRSVIHVLDTVQQSFCNGDCDPRKPR